MTKIGNYYYGIDVDGFKYFRISLYPFGFSISADERFGLVFEFSLLHIKIFFGSKIDDKF